MVLFTVDSLQVAGQESPRTRPGAGGEGQHRNLKHLGLNYSLAIVRNQGGTKRSIEGSRGFRLWHTECTTLVFCCVNPLKSRTSLFKTQVKRAAGAIHPHAWCSRADSTSHVRSCGVTRDTRSLNFKHLLARI